MTIFKSDLIGIYQYKFTLKPEELKNFSSNHTAHNFIESFTKVQDIQYDPCIELFSSNNSLFLFFSKDNQKKNKKSNTNKETNEDSEKNNKIEEPIIISLNDKNKIQKTQRKVRFNLNQNNKSMKK